MVKVMGYFDDAIAEREESLEHGEFSGSDIIELSEEEYLEHGRFGSFRKTHKYIDRVWKGGRWVYRYAKKAAGYAYGSEYRKDMDKYHDVEDRAQANMWKANEDNWKLKNKIEDNAKNGGPNAVINGKALRKEKERNQEYFDKEYAKALDANDKYSHAGTKYYKSLAYKVEKATGAFDKGRAERARKKGYDGLAEKHEEAYNNAPAVKVKKAVKSTTSKLKKKFKHDDEDGEIMTYFPARDENSLEHHGILGQKWGIRRFQNKDGSLTQLGKQRASEGAEGISKVLKKGQADARNIRIAGKVKGLGAQAALTVGSSAAGAAFGSLTGNPAAATGGMIGGAIGGSGAGRAVNEIIKMHANEKAAALSQEYQLLGQKMMEEYGKQKVSETQNKKDSIAGNFGNVPEEWKGYYDNKDGYEISKASFSKQKVGGKEIDFVVDNNRSDISNEEAAKNASKFLTNFDDSKAREAIAKEIYDSYGRAEEYKARGISREQFKKNISPRFGRVVGDSYEMSYDDGGLAGGHSLDVEGNLKTAKIRDVSMNG